MNPLLLPCCLLLQGQDGYCLTNSTRLTGRFKASLLITHPMSTCCLWHVAACCQPSSYSLHPSQRDRSSWEPSLPWCSLALTWHQRLALTLCTAVLRPGVNWDNGLASQYSHSALFPRSLQGFARVPRCDDAALQEALYSRGPLAISFDASRPSFRFYSHGVYADSEVRAYACVHGCVCGHVRV